MSKRKNGYTVIEVLIASTLFFQSLLLLIPMQSNLQTYKEVLKERRFAATKLSEELQMMLRNRGPFRATEFELETNGTIFHYRFFAEKEYIKGCVEWTNAEMAEEEFCLSGLLEK